MAFYADGYRELRENSHKRIGYGVMTTLEKAELRRSFHGFLAVVERSALTWLAARMPQWVTPDRLTGIGFVGALMVFVGYSGSARYPELLWIATLGLAVNWFGDSLDGSLARYRHIERPRYGFYLDNSLDVLEQLLLAIGFWLSGILRPELALLGLCVFYMMSILTLIRAQVSSEFSMDYGGIGTTEMRVFFVILNILVFFFPPKIFEIAGILVTYPNLLSVTWISLTVATFLVAMSKDLRKLAREDPPPTDRLTSEPIQQVVVQFPET
jgi:archaetidylinositol phosphate synthase